MKHKQRLHKLPETSAFKNCGTSVNRRSSRQIDFCLSHRGRFVMSVNIVSFSKESIQYRIVMRRVSTPTRRFTVFVLLNLQEEHVTVPPTLFDWQVTYRWVWSRNTSRTLSLYNDAEPGRRRAGEFGSAWHFLQCVRDQRPACSQTPCFVVFFFVESSVSCQAAANRCCSEGGKQAAFNPYLTGGVWDSGPGLMLQEDHQRRTVYSRIQRAGEPASFTLSVTTF